MLNSSAKNIHLNLRPFKCPLFWLKEWHKQVLAGRQACLIVWADRESTQRATVPALNRRGPRGPLRVLFKCLEDEAAITATQTERSLMNFIEIPPPESNGVRIDSQEGVKRREAEGKLPVHPSLVFTHPSRTNLTLLWMLPRESAVFSLCFSLSSFIHSSQLETHSCAFALWEVAWGCLMCDDHVLRPLVLFV